MFEVLQGQMFGFYAMAQDGLGGSASTVVGNFAAPAAVPATVPTPATLALFGLGLAGLGWSRRKKA